jgi:hypothetical protein
MKNCTLGVKQQSLTHYFLWVSIKSLFHKRQRKPKGQSRMDNPEKLATLGTQDTGRRQTKHKIQNAIGVRQINT